MNNALITALATPFKKGKIDVNSYIRLVKSQSEHADALLCLGTTAETQLLSECEKRLLVSLAKGTADKTPIIAGIEETATALAVKAAEKYQKLGADALLIAPPSFCKCTPNGYYRHVKAIKNAADIPLILYNIPSRCGYALNAEVIKKLYEKEGVRYVKDAGNDLTYTAEISRYMTVFCGNDEKLPDYLDAGAGGVISVAANVAPKLTRQILDGELSEEFTTLARLTMREINPIAIKYCLYKAGIFDEYDMRLPLTRASKRTRKAIDEFLQKSAEKIK